MGAGAEAGQGGTVLVPVVQLDEAVRSSLAGDPSVDAGRAVILLLKLDAAGREADVLEGAKELLDSGRVLNVVIEINKQRMAIARGMASAKAAAENWRNVSAGDGEDWGEGEASAAVPTAAASQDRGLEVTDAENVVLSAEIAAYVRALLARGYEVLSANRGWWAAQEPLGSKKANPTEEWALNLGRHREVDIYAFLPATRASTLQP